MYESEDGSLTQTDQLEDPKLIEYKKLFKENFLAHIENYLKSPEDTSSNKKTNNPYSVIKRSTTISIGTFTRILDEFGMPVPSYEDFKSWVQQPNCIGTFMQSLLDDEILPFVLNEYRTALSPQLIQAINHNDKQNYNALVQKAGDNPTSVAELFIQAIINGYCQRMLDSLNDKDKFNWFKNESTEFEILAQNVTVNGLRESVQKTLIITSEELLEAIENLRSQIIGNKSWEERNSDERKVYDILDTGETSIHLSMLKTYQSYLKAINTIFSDFKELSPKQNQSLYKIVTEDAHLFQYASQDLKSQIDFFIAFNELKETVNNSPLEVKQAVGNLLSVVKKLKDDGDISISDLPRITEYLKDTTALITNPTDAAYNKHNDNIKDAIGKNRKWGPIIGGAMLCIGGILLVAAAITVTVLTFGVSSPLTIPALAAGGSIAIAGIALSAGTFTAAAAIGLATTGIIGVGVASKAGMFVHEAIEGPVATAMREVGEGVRSIKDRLNDEKNKKTDEESDSNSINPNG